MSVSVKAMMRRYDYAYVNIFLVHLIIQFLSL